MVTLLYKDFLQKPGKFHTSLSESYFSSPPFFFCHTKKKTIILISSIALDKKEEMFILFYLSYSVLQQCELLMHSVCCP